MNKTTNKNMQKYRHGDLSFHPSKLEKGMKKIASNRYVLAEGETTGHCHVIEGKVDVYEDAGGLVIKANGKTVLTHPEHKTIEFPKGTYRMKQEREMDWFANVERKVID